MGWYRLRYAAGVSNKCDIKTESVHDSFHAYMIKPCAAWMLDCMKLHVYIYACAVVWNCTAITNHKSTEMHALDCSYCICMHGCVYLLHIRATCPRWLRWNLCWYWVAADGCATIASRLWTQQLTSKHAIGVVSWITCWMCYARRCGQISIVDTQTHFLN